MEVAARIVSPLPDPSALAATSKQLNLICTQLEPEWFERNRRLQAPGRPWQYSVLTWRRLRRRAPDSLAAWMLRHARRLRHATQEDGAHEVDQHTGGSDVARIGGKSGHVSGSGADINKGIDSDIDSDSDTDSDSCIEGGRRSAGPRSRGRGGRRDDLDRSEAHLRKGDAVRALLALCGPRGRLLLLPYAA